MHDWELNITNIKYSIYMYRECKTCGLIVSHMHEDNDEDLPTCEEVIMNEALE